MKRYGNIFAKIYDMENLREAHRKARKDKRFYREVKMVDADEDKFLLRIQKMLMDGTYKVSAEDYAVSTINDKGKERELWKLPYYPHRIIQWAIMLQIEHVFMETFCHHVCASIKGRGIRRAYELTRRYMRDAENSRYCLKIDISKFYPNIDHAILKRLLRKKFKDAALLSLLDMIIDSYPGEKGVPIGSYLSQFLANFYLAYFDHWLKEEMKVTRVIRYMDDIVIFHRSKNFLHWLFLKMSGYLDKNLRLNVKPNWQIFPSAVRGVDFVGYRFFRGYILLRKGTCKRFKRRMRKIREKRDAGEDMDYHEWCSANSYIGWLIWCDSWRLYEKYVTPVLPLLTAFYRRRIRQDDRNYRRKLFSKKGRMAA